MKTEVIHLSEVPDLLWRIFEIRNPEKVAEHRKALSQYKRRLGKREEVTGNVTEGYFSHKATGFKTTVMGKEVFIERPKLQPRGYGYMRGYRIGEASRPAQQIGLLPNSLYNRDLDNNRVKKYMETMLAGQWHDLLSDPIAITNDGQIVNGQHRLAAADQLTLEPGDPDPVFLVIWGVKPQEAMYADGSRRTHRDEATIAKKLLTTAQSTPTPATPSANRNSVAEIDPEMEALIAAGE